jgi:hypothetical protein
VTYNLDAPEHALCSETMAALRAQIERVIRQRDDAWACIERLRTLAKAALDTDGSPHKDRLVDEAISKLQEGDL